jgi:enoyl-CoA hydratase/carnithine racemase
MLLHADLVYAQQGTRFQLPFVSLGLVPEGAASLLLPARAGYLQAAELLLLAQMFDAQTALDAKLVNAVVDDAEAAADKAIARLLELPTKSLQMTKALLKPVELVQKSIDCINAEAKDFVQRTAEEDMQEAVAAFMQKRKPVFK